MGTHRKRAGRSWGSDAQGVAGEPVYGPALSVWPGTEGGPPVYLGAWRSPRWIDLAARPISTIAGSSLSVAKRALPQRINQCG